MNYKRRRRKRGGVKGCCAMCADRIRQRGLRNKRRPTMQEKRSAQGIVADAAAIR